jgi:flagellar biosynthetic protein FlhB
MTGFTMEWIVIALGLIGWTGIYWRSLAGFVPELQPQPGAGAFPLYFAATEEKTEPATPHRKQEARKKGQVGKSSDLNAALVMIAVIVVLYSIRGYFGENISTYVRYILSQEMNTALNSTQLFDLYKMSLLLCLKVLAPVLGAVVIFGILANLMQVGILFSSEAMKPKLSHINPVEGFKRIFSKRAVFEFVKTLLKVLVIGLVVFNLAQKAYPQLLLLFNMSLAKSIDYIAKLIFRITITATVTFFIIAILDFVYQKWEFGRSLRMSVDEVKKEFKQTEGDPQIKAQIRAKQRMMSMNRMMQSIPEATVVVTNPTHLAVVLKYDDTMEAPQITAKGAGYVAQRIKEKAAEHNIPIVEDKPLARSLFKSSEIGDFVPVDLYQAVAGVIAAIYALKK